jgi:hypothetical protein
MVERFEPDADILAVHASTWIRKLKRFRRPGRKRPVSLVLLDDRRDDAGADGAATFADGEAQLLFHRDRHDQLNLNDTLSPGITISVPSGSVTTPVTSVVRK